MATHNIVETPTGSSMPMPSSPRFVNLTNRRFGRFVVKWFSHMNGNSFWFALCDCGVTKLVNSNSLIKGTSRSCGCLNRETLIANKTTHGEYRDYKTSPEMQAFRRAMARCKNPKNKSYYRYGGRGIRFCFTSFAAFILDVGRRPSSDHSLDRKNNNGNYEPGNVRWATAQEQARNRRTGKLLNALGETHLLCEWQDITGLKEGTIRQRLKSGWCPDCVVTVKVKGNPCYHKSSIKLGGN